eukprot:6492190-Amphidinium_carterae.3
MIIDERMGPVSCCNSDELELAQPSTPAFMPNSLPIPGICHLTHNTVKAITSKMAYWSVFWTELKVLESVLTSDDYMRCLIGVHTSSKAVFKRQPPQLYDKRWSVIADFVKAALPQALVLKHAWYDFAASEEKNLGIDGKALSALLQSTMFIGYLHMTLLLHSHIEQIPNWAEGCTCHHWPQGERSRMRESFVDDFQERAKVLPSCPMSNMRLPELVASALKIPGAHSPVSTGFDVSRLILEVGSMTTQAEWEVIHKDYLTGCKSAELEMSIRLNFAARLPWCLGGLSHHHPTIVRVVAKHCVREFDQLLPEAQACLSPWVHNFLAMDKPWRLEMDNLSCDGRLLKRSDAFVSAVASLRFCPLSERTIEAGHKDIKTGHSYTKFGPSSAASQLRAFPLLVRPLLTHPSFFQRIAACLKEVQMPADAARLFHAHSHPQLQVFWRPGQNVHAKVLRMTAHILYKCDTTSVFADLQGLRIAHRQQLLQLEGKAARAISCKETLTMDSLMQRYLLEHWRGKLQDNSIVALPVGVTSMFSLHAATHDGDAEDEVHAHTHIQAVQVRRVLKMRSRALALAWLNKMSIAQASMPILFL